jgi:hypothetical protein
VRALPNLKLNQKESIMSVTCDVIIKWNATPDQLAALGTALWGWCNCTAGRTGIYQFLDNQALADLMAGKLPIVDQPPLASDRRGVHFRARDRSSRNGRAAIDTLRRELPAEAIEQVLVDGISWNTVDLEDRTVPALLGGRALQLIKR